MMNGCTVGQMIWRVIMPLVLPGIVAVSIFAFILAWDGVLLCAHPCKQPGNWVMYRSA